jgi:hypothetical protein
VQTGWEQSVLQISESKAAEEEMLLSLLSESLNRFEQIERGGGGEGRGGHASTRAARFASTGPSEAHLVPEPRGYRASRV